MNKIAVDARPLSRGTGGIQRYLEEIVIKIAASKRAKLYLYADGDINSELLQQMTRMGAIFRISKPGSLSWNLSVKKWIAIDQPTIFWSPRHHFPLWLNRDIEKIVTIHDFVWKKHPTTMPLLQFMNERLLMVRALKSATKIICISESTLNDLGEYYPEYKHKSTVIKHGVNIKANPMVNTHRKGGYYLAVGTLEPRKNYVKLIEGFSKYVTKGGTKSLKIVGKLGWKYQTILTTAVSVKNAGKIALMTTVNDTELDELYKNAFALISPSIDEGYGLPAQEAEARSVPLLLSSIPTYLELFPSAMIFFDPSSTTAIMEALLSAEKLTYIEPITPNKWSWDDCCNAHLNLFLSN